METDLIREFKALTDETDEDKISSFIAGAERTVLIKTNRKTLINELEEAVLQLAVARYNKNGNEGLGSYSEGGINESYLSEDDILIVQADHGNDPDIGNSKHTRECVPLLIYRKGLKGVNVGVRKTMSDNAATCLDYFGVEAPENGTSYLDLLENVY